MLLLMESFLAAAQYKLIGKVTDLQSGIALSSATVRVVNSPIFVLTDNNGEFSLTSASRIDTIEISLVGYEKHYLKIKDTHRHLMIVLKANAVNLNNVTVTGYENNRKLLEIAGAVTVLKPEEMQRGDNRDIMSALNTVPGVKMEAYSTGNYRISIRGSLVNNPWGIRNVKIYWNDIPLSSPDGTAQKSIDLDPALIGSVEVLKGPSGSIYGAGNGGVLLIKNSKAEFGENALEAGYTGGSYGFGRFYTSYNTANKNFSISTNIVSQRYDGYRENNWGDKDVINLFSQFTPDEKRTVSFFVTHATGSLGIAGGLSQAQVDSMPRQALPYSKDNKTSVKRYDATALGVSQSYHFSNLFSNITSVYGNFQTYDHPFGSSIYYNGYFKESLTGYGGRTKFVFTPMADKIKSRFSIGAEYQYQHQFENTFNIINDLPGTWPEAGDLYQNDIIASKSKIIFAQAEFDLPSQFFLAAGASYTQLSYDILDLFRATTHVNYSGLLQFPVKISPRVGLVKVISNHFAIHGSMSYGYSPPPVWEINNYDGTLNKEIKPEDGVNYEMGIRGNTADNKLVFDVTAYQMYLKNAIVPTVRPNGTTAYKNAGRTNQQGLEAMLSYLFINNPTKSVSFLKLWTNYTYNDYLFEDYISQSFNWVSSSVITVDNSGKKVTGVVPNSLAAGIDLETKYGLYFNAGYNYYDKIPLNDANTYYSDSYSLLNLKLGYTQSFQRFKINISGGINNVLNTSYSSLILYNADANGVPPQFFNPSPGINFYGGFSLKYNLTK